jgi:hypothetical protein
MLLSSPPCSARLWPRRCTSHDLSVFFMVIQAVQSCRNGPHTCCVSLNSMQPQPNFRQTFQQK